MTGYVNPPNDVKIAEGMNYNIAFPGHQIAMINPFGGGDGMIKYTDGTPATVDNYARDIAAFLAWVSDPKLEERKRIGLAVFLYLLVTGVLLYFAKKRVWERVAH
jgi:ubiquinol-cytochrome c reductase cytochrome b/c1 subunit